MSSQSSTHTLRDHADEGSASRPFLSSSITLHLYLVKPNMLVHLLLSLPMAVFSYPTIHIVFMFVKLLEWECSQMGLTLEVQSLELFSNAWVRY
jgi:hypothetical protein